MVEVNKEIRLSPQQLSSSPTDLDGHNDGRQVPLVRVLSAAWVSEAASEHESALMVLLVLIAFRSDRKIGSNGFFLSGNWINRRRIGLLRVS